MSYQTGTASSASNLVTTLQTFATGHGFTLSGSVLSAGDSHTRVQGDTRSIDHVATDIGNISYEYVGLTGATDSGFTTNVTPTGFSTLPSTACVLIPTSNWPVTYFLYAGTTPTELFCALRYGDGLHAWFTFGMLKKSTTAYTGGNYFAATYSSQSAALGEVMIPRDLGFTCNPTYTAMSGGLFFWGGQNYQRSYRNSYVYTSINGVGWGSEDITGTPTYPSCNNLIGTLLTRSPNIWNSQTTLLPIRLTLPVASNFQMDLGSMHHIRLLRMDYLNPGDTITIGSDVWKVFPFCQKDTIYRDGYDLCFHYSATITAVDLPGWNSPWLHGPRTGTYAFAFKIN